MFLEVHRGEKFGKNGLPFIDCFASEILHPIGILNPIIAEMANQRLEIELFGTNLVLMELNLV